MIKKLTHEQIVSRQVRRLSLVKAPLAVLLDNIRSLNNVGSIFRTADGAGIEKLWLCGLTGYPPQSGITKTSLGAEETVPWEYHPDSLAVARRLKNEGYRIVVLEQAAGGIPVECFYTQDKVCLVLGNEIEGVSDELCAMADAAVEIGMRGVKNSLNVAVAFGVAAYFLTLDWRSEPPRSG